MSDNFDYKDEIKVVGFDLDQTLYSKSAQIDEAIQSYLYERIAEKKNCSLEEAKELFMSLYKGGNGLSGSRTMEALGFDNGRELVQQALEVADIASYLEPDERVIEMLRRVSQKYHMDLITSRGRAQVESCLEAMDIPTEFFSHILTSESASKSSGEAYKIWLSNYPELEPKEFLYIGDRANSDCEVPTSLGIKSILVNQDEKSESILCPQLEHLLDIEGYLF